MTVQWFVITQDEELHRLGTTELVAVETMLYVVHRLLNGRPWGGNGGEGGVVGERDVVITTIDDHRQVG